MIARSYPEIIFAISQRFMIKYANILEMNVLPYSFSYLF